MIIKFTTVIERESKTEHRLSSTITSVSFCNYSLQDPHPSSLIILSYYYMPRGTAHSRLSITVCQVILSHPPPPPTPPHTHIFSRTTDQHQLQPATKWVETLCPKRAFWHFTDFKRAKLSFSSPTPSMQCAAVWATYRKWETPQLWMEGTGKGLWIL